MVIPMDPGAAREHLERLGTHLGGPTRKGEEAWEDIAGWGMEDGLDRWVQERVARRLARLLAEDTAECARLAEVPGMEAVHKETRPARRRVVWDLEFVAEGMDRPRKGEELVRDGWEVLREAAGGWIQAQPEECRKPPPKAGDGDDEDPGTEGEGGN